MGAPERAERDRRDGWGPNCAQHNDQVERVCRLDEALQAVAKAVADDSKELVRVTASLGTWARAVAALQVIVVFAAGGLWTEYRAARDKREAELVEMAERWQTAQLALRELEAGRKENRGLIELILRSHKIEAVP